MAMPRLAAIGLFAALCALPASGQCVGGPVKACECLLGCEVFGGDTTPCHANANETTAVTDKIVQEQLKAQGKKCAATTCVVQCSAQMKCLDPVIVQHCEKVKSTHADCSVDCNSAPRRGHTSGSVPAILVTAASVVMAKAFAQLS